VNLDWKIGIAAKDWDSVAKKEKIEVSRYDLCDFTSQWLTIT